MMNDQFLVMVIEDHDELREATVAMLQQAGYDVLCAASAEDVDEMENSRCVDLYVVDLNLPGEDGLSLVQRLRRVHQTAGIVIATARSRLDDRLQGYESGADIHLSKPIAPQELLATLSSLARRVRAGKRRVEVFILDAKTQKLSGPQGDARLSHAEVRLLTSLAVARNNTLERWQVMLHMADSDRELSSNTLQVRISNLRKKLAACGVEQDAIIGIRNEGYRLCVPLQVEV